MIQLITDTRMGRINFIGHDFCSFTGELVRCQVEDCDNYVDNRDQFIYSWFKNYGVPIEADDAEFSVTVDTTTCTSNLAVLPGGYNAATDVTCIVTTPDPAHTVSVTSFVFPPGKL